MTYLNLWENLKTARKWQSELGNSSLELSEINFVKQQCGEFILTSTIACAN